METSQCTDDMWELMKDHEHSDQVAAMQENPLPQGEADIAINPLSMRDIDDDSLTAFAATPISIPSSTSLIDDDKDVQFTDDTDRLKASDDQDNKSIKATNTLLYNL